MWEDERNRQGGRWLVNTQKTFRQQELDRLWLETVSESFISRYFTVLGSVLLQVSVVQLQYLAIEHDHYFL